MASQLDTRIEVEARHSETRRSIIACQPTLTHTFCATLTYARPAGATKRCTIHAVIRSDQHELYIDYPYVTTYSPRRDGRVYATPRSKFVNGLNAVDDSPVFF